MVIRMLGEANGIPQFVEQSQLPQDLRDLVKTVLEDGYKVHLRKKTKSLYLTSVQKGTSCVGQKTLGNGSNRNGGAKNEACPDCISKQRVCIEAIVGQSKFILMPLPAVDRANQSSTDTAYYVKP